MDFIKDNAVLTKNAKNKWSEKRKQAKMNTECEGPGALFTYLRRFNPIYYGTTIMSLLPKRQPIVEATFDLKDPFCITDMRTKGVERKYQLDGDAEKIDYDLSLIKDLVCTFLRREMRRTTE